MTIVVIGFMPVYRPGHEKRPMGRTPSELVATMGAKLEAVMAVDDFMSATESISAMHRGCRRPPVPTIVMVVAPEH